MASRLKKMRASTFSWSSLDFVAPWLLFLGVIWLCWQLASMFWLFVNPPTAPQARTVMLGGAVPNNVPNIIGFRLFAEHGSASGNSQPDVPMQLEGVFVAQPDSLSAAVINVKNASTRYRVGQRIEGTNYQLASVDWNQVSLQRDDGTMQTLKFGDGNASSANALITPNPAFQPQNPNQQAQAALDDAIRQMKTNPNAYLNQMGLAMAGRGGHGYEVTGNVPANVRNQMGLRTGDRVISINGQPVGNPANDAQLLQQVQQSHSAQVQIQRGDQTLTIQQNF